MDQKGNPTMAKREIRIITASSDVAAIIDRGADVDTQLKNLGYEDKGLKTKIAEAAQNQLSVDELSVRLVGQKSAAVVSGVEKVDLDAGAEKFAIVRAAIDKGLLAEYVERTVSLVVPPGDVDRAAEELRKIGIKATVTETLKVTAESMRRIGEVRSTSLEVAEAEVALSKCIKKDVSIRIKYERI